MNAAFVRNIADVKGISISLTINEIPALFILLAEEGLINRMGTGSLNNTEDALFVGPGDPAIFQQVRSRLTQGILQMLGGEFHCENIRGASCRLTIAFQFKDNTSDGLAFLYGSQSGGPPKEIRIFVIAAGFLTESGYEEFKRTAAKSGHGHGAPSGASGAHRSTLLGGLRDWFRTLR